VSDPSRHHVDALAAMIAPLADPPTNYQIYDGKVTRDDGALEDPYLVIWAAPGSRTQINLPGNQSDLTTVTQITAVGRDRTEVLAALDRVAELLQGRRPTIAGRLPGLFRQVSENPYVRPTDTVRGPDGQACYQGVIQFQLNSTAAPAT
jgi:hypothetical protein